MSVFYNPRTQTVRPWVYVVILLVPLVMIVIGIWGGKKIVDKMAKRDRVSEKEETPDIFNRNRESLPGK